MKRLPLGLLALASVLAASNAGAFPQAMQEMQEMDLGSGNSGETPKAGFAVPKREAVHRCDLATLDKIAASSDPTQYAKYLDGVLIRMPAAVADRGAADGNTLCNHEIWNMIGKSKKLKAQWDKAGLSDQVRIIKLVDGAFFDLDKQADKVLNSAEEVFKTGDSLGITATSVGPIDASVNPNRAEPKNKVTAVKDVKILTKAEAIKDGKVASTLSYEDLAKAIGDLAEGPDGDAKTGKPVRPGKKVVAYLKEVENLRKTFSDLKGSRLSDVEFTFGGAIPAESANIVEIHKAVGFEFMEGALMATPDKKLRGGAMASFDWNLNSLLAAYHARVFAVYKQINDVAAATDAKTPGGLKAKAEELAQADGAKALGLKTSQLEDKLKGATLDEMGLKALYDKAKAAPAGNDDWKKGASADQVSAVEAVRAGHIVGSDKNMRFEYTPKPDAPQRSIPVTPAMSDGDIQKVAKGVAADIVGGNDALAKFKAAAAAVTGTGGDQAVRNDQTGAPDQAVDPVTGKQKAGTNPDAVVPSGSVAGNVVGPSAATGLKSGCGKGKTLADYKKQQADKLRDKDAKQSAERQKLEGEYADKLTDAQRGLDEKVAPQKPWESESDYQARVDKNPAAKRAFIQANTDADAWYAGEQKKLGSREAQSDKLQKGVTQAEKDAEVKLRGEIRAKVESLRTDFGASGYYNGSDDVEAAMAKKFIKPESWASQIDKGDVDAYFASQWPGAQKGAKSGDETGTYKANLDWCFNGQVRVDNGSDVENCVGSLLGNYIADRAAKRPKTPARPKVGAGDRAKAIERAQRCQELGLPATCTDDDMKKKAGPN